MASAFIACQTQNDKLQEGRHWYACISHLCFSKQCMPGDMYLRSESSETSLKVFYVGSWGSFSLQWLHQALLAVFLGIATLHSPVTPVTCADLVYTRNDVISHSACCSELLFGQNVCWPKQFGTSACYLSLTCTLISRRCIILAGLHAPVQSWSSGLHAVQLE